MMPDLRDSMLDGYIRQRPPEHRPLFALHAPADYPRFRLPRWRWLSVCAQTLTADWEYVYVQHGLVKADRLRGEETTDDA